MTAGNDSRAGVDDGRASRKATRGSAATRLAGSHAAGGEVRNTAGIAAGVTEVAAFAVLAALALAGAGADNR
jgi:hypothetical protein